MGAKGMEEKMSLVIGDKALSSWSLRPWLVMKVSKIAFREEQIRLRRPDTGAEIARHSPSGRVPVLKHGALTVWDSLAICEYLAELAPEARLWPKDPGARASARAVSAEMHAGFHALRNEFPMDFHARIGGRLPSEQASTDIARVVSIWREMRHKYGATGPFLFGAFSIADAMYAPVTTRFRTYGINLAAHGDDASATNYAQTILALPAMKQWGEGAATEPV
jgi:glutathione S-transferase